MPATEFSARSKDIQLFNYSVAVRMQYDVSSLLGCSVDVVDSDALERERYFANEVQKDMVAI